jgi:FkbM family methyltransferase
MIVLIACSGRVEEKKTGAQEVGSWVDEAIFAARRTANMRDARRLLANTALFHLANRGLVTDRQIILSIKVLIGDRWRPLTLRTGKIGDLFILYEVLAFEAYQIPGSIIAPHSVETIVDCGANIGLTALYFASAYPAARIYCVEADPDNFAVLQANAASEPRLVPIHACIVATPQTSARFDNQGPAWGRHNLEITNANGASVPAITLDELLERYALARVDLLKMDIEGAEREVLAAGNYLDAVQHIVAELHAGYSLADFSRAVAKHGLRARPPDHACIATTAHRALESR